MIKRYSSVKVDRLLQELHVLADHAPAHMREPIRSLKTVRGDTLVHIYCLYCLLNYQRDDRRRLIWITNPSTEHFMRDILIDRYTYKIKMREYAISRYYTYLEDV